MKGFIMNTSIKRLLLTVSMVAMCAQTSIVSATKQEPAQKYTLKKAIKAGGYLVGGALMLALPYVLIIKMKKQYDIDKFCTLHTTLVDTTVSNNSYTEQYKFSEENLKIFRNLLCDINFYNYARIPAMLVSLLGVMTVSELEKSDRNNDSNEDQQKPQPEKDEMVDEKKTDSNDHGLDIAA